MTDGYYAKVHHVDGPPGSPTAVFEVKTLKSVIELRPSWWRHPIRRWKLRHLLPDMEASERESRELLGDERYEAFQRRMDDAFLNGTGAAP